MHPRPTGETTAVFDGLAHSTVISLYLGTATVWVGSATLYVGRRLRRLEGDWT
jgi:hypothetical protein